MSSSHNETPAPHHRNNDRLVRDFFAFYVATLLFFAVGIITTLGLDWYGSLNTPVWMPHELVIAAVWGMLFITTVVSISLYCDAEPKSKRAFQNTMLLYMGNALLVLLWNYLFFGIHQLLLALWTAIAVGVTVIALMLRVRSTSRLSAWLLVPYLLWMVCAIAINYTIMLMN